MLKNCEVVRMENAIKRQRSPEELELDDKLAQLAYLEALLAERELELVTLQVDLNVFEQEYQQVIGVRYAELNKIEAEINRYLAYFKPINPKTEQVGHKMPTNNQVNPELTKDTHPSRDRLKKLYREAAKQIHPDFTTDTDECARRHKLMAEVNQAYENNDELQLETILHRWQHSPELVPGEGIAFDLVRTIRKIAQSKENLALVDSKIAALKKCNLYQLLEKVSTAQHQGEDLLAEMAHQIDQQMAEPKLRLEVLKARLTKNYEFE